MKNKTQALELELELLELEAEQEEFQEALEKYDSKRRMGLVIFYIGICIPILVSFFYRSTILPMLILFIFLLPFGLYLREGSERFTIKRKMKENRVQVREIKKSLLHLKYEE